MKGENTHEKFDPQPSCSAGHDRCYAHRGRDDVGQEGAALGTRRGMRVCSHACMGGLKRVSRSAHAGMGVTSRWGRACGQHLARVGPDTSKLGDVRVSSMCARVGQWGLYLGDVGENDGDLDKDLGPVGRYLVMSDSVRKTQTHLSPNLCLMEGMQEMYSSRRYRSPVQRVKC
jgi:hypothetical protein